MLKSIIIFLFCFSVNTCYSQYNWKQDKDKSGIKVYLSNVAGSSFKAIKVECSFIGTYSKLIDLLLNVPDFTNWIYRNKTSAIMKQNNAHDLIYYSETSMPWPVDNRDVVIHMKINTDSLPHFLTITGYNEPDIMPELYGKVRVPHYKAEWKVTMPTMQTIQISYILEIDPGGSLPAWLANSFADKGPIETFSKLAERLK